MPARSPVASLLVCSLTALLLSACAVEAPLGWQAELERSIVDQSAVFDCDPILANRSLALQDSELLAGDELLYGICLQVGTARTIWYLKIRILELLDKQWSEGRFVQDFEFCVQPNEARRKRERERSLAFRELVLKQGSDAFLHVVPVARIQVEAFDAEGASLSLAESSVAVSRLRTGLLPACKAGHAQHDVMAGRVALGRHAEMLELDDQQYDDVNTVADGVAASELFFTILRSNPVTKNILFEVIALPSLWSLVTNLGVRVGFEIDFFASQRLAPKQLSVAKRELWSVPLTLQLNGQPAMLARLVAGPSGSPDAAGAGIFAIVGQHPSDADRRLYVQLLGSKRGAKVGEK